MIIIPELEQIVITPPRTGSTSLRAAILERYKHAYSPHDHMEFAGRPPGIEHYDQVVMIRHPLQRLFSMYQYMRTYENENARMWIDSVRKDTDRSFSDWLLNSKHPFVDPYLGPGTGRRYEQFVYSPAVQKSVVDGYSGTPLGKPPGYMIVYLKLEKLHNIETWFDIKLPHFNVTADVEIDAVSCQAATFILDEFHSADFELYGPQHSGIITT